MKMEVIHIEKRLCTCCMEEHEIKTIRMKEHTTFKNIPLDYQAVYFFCETADELYMNEEMLGKNDIAMKDAYRKEMGLLTSCEIGRVREKYGISQKDLCTLLGWGAKTITRYESHQIQDKAHDSILKKIAQDPEWFLYLLREARGLLAEKSYHEYFETATALYEENQDNYLRRAIEARYARFRNEEGFRGNQNLSLDKVVDVIRYLSGTSRVTNLYKVKLMKLLWYADALSYKKRGQTITGLVYQALPMGAVPVGHDFIINLKGVPCEEMDMGEFFAYHFYLPGQKDCHFLEKEEKEILDIVIDKLGKMSKDEIVSFMHKEQAYKETAPRELISFAYAKNLQI